VKVEVSPEVIGGIVEDALLEGDADDDGAPEGSEQHSHPGPLVHGSSFTCITR
jgi:hypothetical protein